MTNKTPEQREAIRQMRERVKNLPMDEFIREMRNLDLARRQFDQIVQQIEKTTPLKGSNHESK